MIDILITVALSTLVVVGVLFAIYLIIIYPIQYILDLKNKLYCAETSRDEWRQQADRWRSKYENN